MKTPIPAAGEAVPAAKQNRTDNEILDDLETVDFQITEIKRAATVADEYISMEISAGNCGNHRKPCTLTAAQIDCILYMTSHIRDLAVKLERDADLAYGREARS